MHAGEILKALQTYKVKDMFCVLAVTNQDLYPKDEWNYVFGLASPTSGCGIFSFARHHPDFYGVDEESKKTEEKKARTWLKRSLGTMTHEIGHMFGLKHCIYFECSINGSNGPFDGQ